MMSLKNKMTLLLVLNCFFSSHLFAQEKATSDYFSTSVKGLPFVKKSQVVNLKDGDNYTLIASIVKQKIGHKIIRRFAYNGSIPGPTIEVEQGAKINVTFINKTDTNQTIHPHGLRLDFRSDGIPGISQKNIVKPGESFVYHFSFPDAGVFWYHPHVREDYTQQMGLYGNFIVRASNKNELEAVNKEIILTLNDILIGEDVQPFSKSQTNYAAMGRFGNVMMINGSEHYKTTVHKNDVVRFYVTNTANTRTFNFKIPHAKMKLVAADASVYEKEIWSDHITIAPAERFIVDVLFEKEGENAIENATPEKNISLGTVRVLKTQNKKLFVNEFNTLHENKNLESEIKKLQVYFDKPVDKNLLLSVDMTMKHMSHDAPEKIEWHDSMPEMNAMMTSNNTVWKLIDTDTKKENMDIHWQFKKGNFYKIKIFNDDKSMHPMQHPIHFHGERFLILSQNGVKTVNFAWKDTVLVPTGDTVEILLDASNPGEWMAHCHISEHLSSGMMLGFSVN